MSKIDFYDGPYILESGNDSVIKWIDHGVPKSCLLDELNSESVPSKVNRVFDFRYIKNQKFLPECSFTIQTTAPIAAISDIHGHFDTAVKLFQHHKIIDKEYNWCFGTGQLVIVGDVFDRGDQVLECLWLIHNLQIQASEVGGQVHFILGNHDLMVLSEDLRYLDQKYAESAVLLESSYTKLFDKSSYLGQWIRSCPIILKVNNSLFVHAGISQEVFDMHLSINDINDRFHNQIFQSYPNDARDNEINKMLLSASGPIWYRGYFDGSMNDKILDQITQYYKVDHIVVGHTRQSQINLLFDGKVIAIDASIQTEADGELLLLKNNKPYRALSDGRLVELS